MSITESCCTFPHGRRGVHALLWSIFAFLFCLSISRGCSFIKIDGYLISINPFIKSDESLGSSLIGLFGYEGIDLDSKNGFVCTPYSPAQVEYFFDPAFKAARAFAILANICSGSTLLLLLITSCLAYPPFILYCMAGFSFFGSLSMILTFVVFASIIGDEPYNGSFYYGGAVAIIGCLCCFITGLLILQIQPPGSHNYVVREPSTNNTPSPYRGSASNTATTTPVVTGKRNFPPAKRVVPQQQEMALPRHNNNQSNSHTNPHTNPNDIEAFQPGTETITETILPDGTTKVVTTVIGIDGSTTVTETIVRTE